MSGMASFITSPSARTTKRSTPWVEGCCGPMLRVMSSVARPPSRVSRCTSTSNPARPISASRLQQALPRGRDTVVLLGLDEVLAQRMPRPVLRHEDAAEVGVALEDDAEEVEDLALLPVGVAPQAGERGDDRIVARRVDLEREEVAVRVRVEVVDDLDHASLRVVDAGEVGEAVELEPRLGLQEAAHLDDLRGRDRRAQVVATRAGEVADRVAEARLQAGMDGCGLERGHQTFAADGVRTSHRSCWIFSCSLTRPSVRASGRGGQPGT